MSKNDGGPAFPGPALHKIVHMPDGREEIINFSGMSLRDYFAVAALQALHCSDERGGIWTKEAEQISARNAYALADAMLAERAK